VSVALGIRHSVRMRHTYPALQYFFTLSHKRNDFRKKKVIEHILCVLIFSTTLSETVLTLRRIEQGVNKNICWSSCKVPVILVII